MAVGFFSVANKQTETLVTHQVDYEDCELSTGDDEWPLSAVGGGSSLLS